METQTPAARLYTIVGDVDPALLQRTDGLIDNDHERTTWTEYRFKEPFEHVDAEGQKHIITPDTVVRRDVHVTLKEWPGEMPTALGQFN